jgi:hypothetical protein
MTDNRITKILDYDLAACPKCGKAHRFKLKVLVQPEGEEKVPMFGGTAASGGKSEVFFTCPDTNKNFTYLVPDSIGGEPIGLASEADIALATTKAQASSPSKSEFAEWVGKSRETALDFCKTMLSTSTGAIPLYFVVLKYIGFEKIGSTALSKFAILPPALYLVAAILYVLAMRPRYELVAQNDFNAFRTRRLERLNQFIIWGTAIFTGATGLAIVILFYGLST